MDVTLEGAARLLGMTEDQVHEMAREGRIPAYRVHSQYRFNRVEIQEWAAAHGRRIAAEIYDGNAEARAQPDLAGALERGGITHALAGNTRDEVLAEVVKLAGVPSGIDRGLLLQLLRSREALASTGIGNGIAIPHPRDPLIVDADGPRLLLCFLAKPVDFGAVDGKPVRVVFTLLAPSVPAHLQLLAKLSLALHDAEFARLLDTSAPAADIVRQARVLEAKLAAPAEEQRQ